MNRVVFFDYLRAIAPFGIVMGHYLQGIGADWWAGFYLGSTFNAVFFAMSAILLGDQWARKGFPKYEFRSFVGRRVKKLALSYYPFLIVVFAFFVVIGYPFTIKELLAQFAFLPMFIRIDELGQLWFLTMIVICYILYFGISNYLPKRTYRLFDILFVIGMLGIIGLGDFWGIRGACLLTWIPWCVSLFLFADKILSSIRKMRRFYVILFFLVINAVTILALMAGLLNFSSFIGQLLCISSGASWIFLFAVFEKNLKRI